MKPKSNIKFYKDEKGEITIDVKLHEETLWLSLQQISDLFDRDKSVISRHLSNIFKTKELSRPQTVAFFATVQQEGNKRVTRDIEYFNLDAILSVGYRVNSKRGTEFRKWSSSVLASHLINGYSLNKKALTHKSLRKLEESIDLLSKTLINQSLVNDVGTQAIEIINKYARTWRILLEYDEDRLKVQDNNNIKTNNVLSYKDATKAITELKKELMFKKEASNLFGHERDYALEAILKNIEQTFDNNFLYPSLQQRAAHLLYFIIKDHPFIDGNKRIGCFLFILYTQIVSLQIKLNDNGLVALALLIAESSPIQKVLMINLIINLFD